MPDLVAAHWHRVLMVLTEQPVCASAVAECSVAYPVFRPKLPASVTILPVLVLV